MAGTTTRRPARGKGAAARSQTPAVPAAAGGEQQQLVIDPQYVIAALQARLQQATEQNVRLEALANQLVAENQALRAGSNGEPPD